MGIALSLDHSLSVDSHGNKAVMVFIYEHGQFQSLSFLDFIRAPLSYSSTPIVIIEPFNGPPPRIVEVTQHHPVSYIDTVRTLHQNFKISQYKVNSYRLWLMVACTLSQSLITEAFQACREFPFSEYSSFAAADPSMVFNDVRQASSFATALRPPSAGMRCSSPIRNAATISVNSLTLNTRRSYEAKSLQTTFMVPDIIPDTPSPPRTTAEVDFVVPGLYIGGEAVAQDKECLEKLGITHVVNMNANVTQSKASDGYMYFGVKMNDSVFEDLNEDFWNAVDFVKKAVASGGIVLVHCRRGISRSAALTVAFLMQTRGISFDAAFAILKKQRPAVNINQGFVEQLKSREVAMMHPPPVPKQRNKMNLKISLF